MNDLFYDNRGYVGSLYRQDSHYQYAFNWVEDRISYSKKGVIRGFHGDSETYKLVYCLYGKLKLIIYDIYNNTVPIVECVLTPESQPVLIQPWTLNAHQCLSDECILFYKWSKYYNLETQFSVYYNDPTINPNWENITPIISERDKNAGTLQEFLKNGKS